MEILKSRSNPWFICFIAALYYFYEFTQITVFNSLSTQILTTFNLNAAELANLSACYFYANIIFLIPAGLLLDRFSIRNIILITMIISIIGTFIFSVSNDIYIAMLGRFISGIGGAFAFISCIRLITKRMSSQKLSFAIGLLITLGFIGGIFSQLPFAYLSEITNWRIALQVLIAFGLVILVLNFILLKREEVKFEKTHNKTNHLTRGIVTTLLNFNTWTAGLYITFMNLPIIILATLWNDWYLTEVDHVTKLTASVVTTLLLIGITIGSPIAGKLSDQLKSRKLPMAVGAILTLIIMVAIIFLPPHYKVGLFFLFFLLGFVSSTQCIGYPALLENNDPAVAGFASSIGSILVMGLGSLLKIGFGWILDYSWHGTYLKDLPSYTADDFKTALAMLPIAFFVAFLLALTIRENKRKSSQEDTGINTFSKEVLIS